MATYTPLKSEPAHTPYPTSPEQPSRSSFIVGAGFVAVAFVAMVLAAVGTLGHHAPRASQQSVGADPIYTSSDVSAATSKACIAWDKAATAMTRASNAVAELPPGWDSADRVRARANETRVVIAETAYLRTQVDPATPVSVRDGIDRYNTLSIAQQNAAIQRLGTSLDKLIDDQNAVSDQLKQQCGLS
ncbi:hypothetical protein A5761_11080 [Mycolicibacterium setense]|uniref:hypothetical protein n=1 Tax=Mycolicibacterium setense TaxID=431269 RepID=UPI0007E9F7FE|nr:hypothetical protein [Mycolicibacterium setense]OBB16995.1 hypothetical protein A5761_11080 [Mycolicibacterium setense]